MFLIILRINSDYSLNSSNLVVFVMEVRSALCAVGTEFVLLYNSRIPRKSDVRFRR